MLDDRKLAVLRAIVTDYVSSKEPVGSRALVERHNLDVSPATIRNDMAFLEEEGYIAQPHTSAGRVPTDKGYRLFVDRLAHLRPLSAAERKAIERLLGGAVDMDDVVTRTVRLLAQLTQQVAIVQYPLVTRAIFRHVDLIRLHGDRGLLIVVNSAGSVSQRALEMPPVSDEVLAVVRTRLNIATEGFAPAQAAERLSSLSGEVQDEEKALAVVAVAALLDVIASENSTRVVVGGVQHLGLLGNQFEVSVKPVLEALEEQVVLMRLLGDATTEVTVRIGHENEHAGLQTTSVVATGYGSDDDVWARLGVVGPTHMDYPSTMASVRAVARYVGRLLAEG